MCQNESLDDVRTTVTVKGKRGKISHSRVAYRIVNRCTESLTGGAGVDRLGGGPERESEKPRIRNKNEGRN